MRASSSAGPAPPCRSACRSVIRVAQPPMRSDGASSRHSLPRGATRRRDVRLEVATAIALQALASSRAVRSALDAQRAADDELRAVETGYANGASSSLDVAEAPARRRGPGDRRYDRGPLRTGARERPALRGDRIVKVFHMLACIALAGCAHPRDESAQQSHSAPAVSLVTARDERFVETVPATGRFGAPTGSQVRLGFPSQGTLSAVPVRLGDRVGVGDVLAELDATRLSLAASEATADERAAEAAVGQARVDRTSAKIRFDQDVLRRARVGALRRGASRRARTSRPRRPSWPTTSRASSLGEGVGRLVRRRCRERASPGRRRAARRRADGAPRSRCGNGRRRAPQAGRDGRREHAGGRARAARPRGRVPAPRYGGRSRPRACRLRAAPLHDRRQRERRDRNGRRGRAGRRSRRAKAGNVTARVDRRDVPDGAMLEARIDVGSADGIVLPEAAIVADPETSATYVFVERRQPDGSARFEQRAVHVEQRDAGRVLVAGAVRPGDRVAAEGSFALLAPAGD